MWNTKLCVQKPVLLAARLFRKAKQCFHLFNFSFQCSCLISWEHFCLLLCLTCQASYRNISYWYLWRNTLSTCQWSEKAVFQVPSLLQELHNQKNASLCEYVMNAYSRWCSTVNWNLVKMPFYELPQEQYFLYD